MKTNPTQSTIALGKPQNGVRFDDAFDVAKTVLGEFDADVVTFTFNDRTINVEHGTTSVEAFEQLNTEQP